MLFWINFAIYAFLVVLVVTCPLMCLVILMQRSKQEGLGAAFGGGFTESIWGAQTSNVLVKATVWAAFFFFILSISLARLYSHRATLMEQGSPVQQLLQKAVVAPTPTNSAGQPVVPTATPMNAAPASAAPASAATPAQPAPVAPPKPAGK